MRLDRLRERDAPPPGSTSGSRSADQRASTAARDPPRTARTAPAWRGSAPGADCPRHPRRSDPASDNNRAPRSRHAQHGPERRREQRPAPWNPAGCVKVGNELVHCPSDRPEATRDLPFRSSLPSTDQNPRTRTGNAGPGRGRGLKHGLGGRRRAPRAGSIWDTMGEHGRQWNALTTAGARPWKTLTSVKLNFSLQALVPPAFRRRPTRSRRSRPTGGKTGP